METKSEHKLKVAFFERGEGGALVQSHTRKYALVVNWDDNILSLKNEVEALYLRIVQSQVHIRELLDGDDCNIEWETNHPIKSYFTVPHNANGNDNLYTLKVVRTINSEEVERREREGTVTGGGSIDFSKARTLALEPAPVSNGILQNAQGIRDPDQALPSNERDTVEAAVVPATPVSRKRRHSGNQQFRGAPASLDGSLQMLRSQMSARVRSKPMSSRTPSANRDQEGPAPLSVVQVRNSYHQDDVHPDSVAENALVGPPSTRKSFSFAATQPESLLETNTEALQRFSNAGTSHHPVWDLSSQEIPSAQPKRPTALTRSASKRIGFRPGKDQNPSKASRMVNGTAQKGGSEQYTDENHGDFVQGSVTPDEIEDAMNIDVPHISVADFTSTSDSSVGQNRSARTSSRSQGQSRQIQDKPSDSGTLPISSLGSGALTNGTGLSETSSSGASTTESRVLIAPSADSTASADLPQTKQTREATTKVVAQSGAEASDSGSDGESLDGSDEEPQSADKNAEDANPKASKSAIDTVDAPRSSRATTTGPASDHTSHSATSKQRVKTVTATKVDQGQGTATDRLRRGLRRQALRGQGQANAGESATEPNQNATRRSTTGEDPESAPVPVTAGKPSDTPKPRGTPSTAKAKANIMTPTARYWAEWREKRLNAAAPTPGSASVETEVPSKQVDTAAAVTKSTPVQGTETNASNKSQKTPAKAKAAANVKKQPMPTRRASGAEKTDAAEITTKKPSPTDLPAQKSTLATPVQRKESMDHANSSAKKPGLKDKLQAKQPENNGKPSVVKPKSVAAEPSAEPDEHRPVSRGLGRAKSDLQLVKEMRQRASQSPANSGATTPIREEAPAPAKKTRLPPGKRDKNAPISARTANKGTNSAVKADLPELSSHRKTDEEKVISASPMEIKIERRGSDATKIEDLPKLTEPTTKAREPIEISSAEESDSDSDSDDASEIPGRPLPEMSQSTNRQVLASKSRSESESSSSSGSDSSDEDSDEDAQETLTRALKVPHSSQSISLTPPVAAPYAPTQVGHGEPRDTEMPDAPVAQAEIDTLKPRRTPVAFQTEEQDNIPPSSRATRRRSSSQANGAVGVASPASRQSENTLDTAPALNIPTQPIKPTISESSSDSEYEVPLPKPSQTHDWKRPLSQATTTSSASAQRRVTSQLNSEATTAQEAPKSSQFGMVDTPTPMPGKGSKLRSIGGLGQSATLRLVSAKPRLTGMMRSKSQSRSSQAARPGSSRKAETGGVHWQAPVDASDSEEAVGSRGLETHVVQNGADEEDEDAEDDDGDDGESDSDDSDDSDERTAAHKRKQSQRSNRSFMRLMNSSKVR